VLTSAPSLKKHKVLASGGKSLKLAPEAAGAAGAAGGGGGGGEGGSSKRSKFLTEDQQELLKRRQQQKVADVTMVESMGMFNAVLKDSERKGAKKAFKASHG
jgi:hypothetical protein